MGCIRSCSENWEKCYNLKRRRPRYRNSTVGPKWGYAEYIAVDQQTFLKKPDTLSFEEALQMCRHDRLAYNTDELLLYHFFLNQKATLTNNINAGTSTKGPITPAKA